MTLTSSLVVMGGYIYDLLEARKQSLGLAAVYYGDQERIPTTPSACVETDTKVKRLKGVSRRYEVELTVYILLYHNKVQSAQDNRREVDALAESIETLLDAQNTCGGLVIHSAVAEVASGYVRKDTLLRANRIRFNALSQAVLPTEAS